MIEDCNTSSTGQSCSDDSSFAYLKAIEPKIQTVLEDIESTLDVFKLALGLYCETEQANLVQITERVTNVLNINTECCNIINLKTQELLNVINNINPCLLPCEFNGGSAVEVEEPTTTEEPVPSTFFVGVGYGDNTLGWSNDGINWNGLGTNIFEIVGTAVAYNGSRWVACGSGTNSIAYSDNGIDWTGCGNSILWEGREIAWNGTVWVVVGSAAIDLEIAAYSYNGADWFPITSEEITTLYSIFWDGTQFIAGGGFGSNNLITSPNGIDWTVHFSGVIGYWLKLTYNGIIWVGVGDEYLGENNNTLAYSYDGLNWIGNGNTIFTTSGESSAWNGTRWVAVGQGGCTVAYSNNGIDWTPVLANVMDSYGGCVLWDGVKFLAGGSGATYNLATSSDGINWTGHTTDVFFEVLNFASNKSKYFYPPIL